MEARSRLAARIDEYVEHAEAMWQDYLAHGPGKRDPSYLEDIESARVALENVLSDPEVAEWLDELGAGNDSRDCLQALIDRLWKLARICATTPQGLNFVTGEAGLIPRADQHADYKLTLVMLRKVASQLH